MTGILSQLYTLYQNVSDRVMSVLAGFSIGMEVYSIDEAFLTVPDRIPNSSLEDFGRAIQQDILQITHVPVGVGFGPTKTLAKLANHAAKSWSKTGGVVDLSQKTRQRKLMALLPVGDVWGVGRRIAAKLKVMGIHTILDLADADIAMIRKTFGVVVERTVRELNGDACIELEEVRKVKEQIISSKSFGKKVERYDDMHQAVCSYAERASMKLREEDQLCSVVSVFVSTSHYSPGSMYSNRAIERLVYPSADTRDIINAAVRALNAIWRDGHQYHKAGIMLSDFTDSKITQFDLFNEVQPFKRSEELMRMLDDMNRSGKFNIGFAGKGCDPTWQMRRGMLSPEYTTNVNEIPIAKVR
ncbi:translesion error-prone DNA polymerase V subunit UmuC [Moellerella wisconsensis]|uniref:translesion error-prone DNA polymerase V subunit UmuC n=1 Tax=Moellerella wisconsensis TaxID=158849 RepID=UPI00307620DD